VNILLQMLGIPQPFEEGQRAAQFNVPKDHNPYGGENYHEWNRGFDFAVEYMSYDDAWRQFDRENQFVEGGAGI